MNTGKSVHIVFLQVGQFLLDQITNSQEMQEEVLKQGIIDIAVKKLPGPSLAAALSAGVSHAWVICCQSQVLCACNLHWNDQCDQFKSCSAYSDCCAADFNNTWLLNIIITYYVQVCCPSWHRACQRRGQLS
jgi:hypothetical protein